MATTNIKKNNLIKTDRYYIIQEPKAKWYMTDQPKGITPYLYKADSWNTIELADKWLLENIENSKEYKVIEVETTFREV